MADFVLRIEELAGINKSGQDPEKARGSFVRFYDPSANDGRGELVLTKDWAQAKVFSDHQEAWEFYQQSYGERPDGKPNRPLTAFTVTVLPLRMAILEVGSGG